MIQAVRNAFVLPDLRKKILFTFLILAIYRLACHVPVPGVNAGALKNVFASNQLLGLLDLLSGGAMAEFSVMAMGVYPYITASIILQLLTPIIPALERLQKDIREMEFRHQTARIAITCSFGVGWIAGLTGMAEHLAEKLFVKADEALYRSKQAGRDQVTIMELTTGDLKKPLRTFDGEEKP